MVRDHVQRRTALGGDHRRLGRDRSSVREPEQRGGRGHGEPRRAEPARPPSRKPRLDRRLRARADDPDEARGVAAGPLERLATRRAAGGTGRRLGPAEQELGDRELAQMCVAHAALRTNLRALSANDCSRFTTVRREIPSTRAISSCSRPST